jgi:transposase
MCMQPYSTDLRQRVLDALDAGMTRLDAVRIFQVSLGSLKRWLKMRRTSGDLTPQRPSGRAPIITPNQYAQLRLQVEAAPDASLADHATQWNADHGTTLSPWTMRRAIRRLGWSRKKRL